MGDDEVVALTVANLRSEKGYDVLLEAARLAVAGGAPVRFVSVGRGPLEAELAAAVTSGGLDRHFTFLGTRTDTARLMAGADIFVLPSHQEGMPVALMEAMSAGLPVVATTVGGVPDVVTDDVHGLLVPPGRPDLLAAAVVRLAGDDVLRARLALASGTASEMFDVRKRGAGRRGALHRAPRGRGRPVSAPVAPRPVDGGDGVALVLHVIPTATARGAQREARALATRLDVPGVRHHRLVSLFEGDAQVVVDLALDHPGGDRPAQGFDPRLVSRLRATLRRSAPTVVVAHGGDPLKYLVPAMLGTRTPLAYYATGTFEHAGSRARVALWRALLRRAAVVAAEGDEVLAQCRELLGVAPARSVLAPNGRDPGEFHPPEPTPGAGDGVPTLAFVGALTPGKRPDRFVEVVARLRRRGVALHAFVSGDGALAPALAGPAAAAGVDLLGSRPDVADLLRGADAFVFASLPTGEGMPGVLIEAGLSALPVVATAVPGVRSVVEDGVGGFVVDVDDVEAMTDATARLLSDPALRRRMGEAARARCVARFSLDAVASCWTSFLDPLVARRVSSRRARNGRDSRRGPGA